MNPAEENEPKPLRIIGIPKRKDGKYVLDEFAILGRECGWICPRCNNEVRICPTKAGEQVFMCKLCGASFTVRVDAEADTFMIDKKKTPIMPHAVAAPAAAKAASPISAPKQEFKPAVGMLLVADDSAPKPESVQPALSNDSHKQPVMPVAQDDEKSGAETKGILQWGGFFSRKRYTLRSGANILGRKDKKTPSDVEFDDPEMSRRSVKIEAIPNGQGGFSYTFTVLKALNAVKVNDRPIAQGECIPMNHDDTIVMGKTTITFKVEK